MTFVKSILIALAMCLPVSALAEGIVLTVKKGEQTVEMTMDDLKSMPVSEFSTSTQWTEEGAHVFAGISLKDFIDRFDVTEGVIHAIAINDYSIEIPVSDAVDGGPIIAYTLDGESMSVREKGPLWVIYPFDAHKEYQSETYYSRSIWQLDRAIFQ